jgi:hypothetical protein
MAQGHHDKTKVKLSKRYLNINNVRFSQKKRKQHKGQKQTKNQMCSLKKGVSVLHTHTHTHTHIYIYIYIYIDI